jgi:hypothetical protein
MRQAFAHDARLDMESDADLRAVGAVVTVALCGHWEHEPPCPLAPHHCSSWRDADGLVHTHVLFAAQPADEAQVRQRIEDALAAGQLPTPDGGITRWRLRAAEAGAVADDEREHAARLAAG